MMSNPYYKTLSQINDIIEKNGLCVHFHKVKAHIGIPGNEKADAAATEAYKGTSSKHHCGGRNA